MNTIVNISSTGQEFSLPGTHWTDAQIRATYSSSVPGINSMQVNESTGEGGNKIFTYSNRTGSKGVK